MAFIGNQPAESFTSFATQEFSTSATTSYTLDHAVTNENEIALFVNNVRQQPGSGKAYTATGTALTLSAATASTDTMYCVFLGRALQTVTPATNSITTAMISDDAVTAAKIADAVSFGKILQVVQTVKTDTFSTTATSFTDVTGLSVAITPASSSNKVLIHVSICFGGGQNLYFHAKLLRGSTDIAIGDAGESSQTRATIPLSLDDANNANYKVKNSQMSFLDSPSTTSATTYKIQAQSYSGDSREMYINRPSNNSDAGYIGRYVSTITAMEVSA